MSAPHRQFAVYPGHPARRLRYLAVTVFYAALCAIGVCLPPNAAHSAEASRRPNVVFILADDLGWGEVGCYGQQRIPTPHIDRLAREGRRYTEHYSGAPVCAPSRCVLMTGQHLGHAEIRGNLPAKVHLPEFPEGQYPLSAEAVTLMQVFQQAGYATGAMGKWGLGPVGSTGEPGRKGIDLFFGYNCQSVAHSFYPPHLWRNSEKIPINQRPIPGHARQPEGDVRLEDWIGETYAPSLMIAEAEAFVTRHRDQPFFLYLPFTEPHVAIHPPKEWVEKFPADWDDAVYRGECGYLPHPRPRAGYAAMIALLDSYVGRILAKLDEYQLAQETIVIFTSDNGATHPRPQSDRFHVGGMDASFFNSTRELKGYKGSVYEGGIRVPLLVRYPGRVPAGTVSEAPSYFADWFPTLCAAVQLTPPEGLDGDNLWPEMTGATTPPRSRPMVWVFPEYGGQVAVRLGRYKVVRQGLKTKNVGLWEVYDITADPGEQHDLSKSHAQIVQQAIEILRRETDDNPLFPLTIAGVNDAR